MRRAQVQQIMIFVIGLVVVGLILLFGYAVIDGLNQDRCEIQRTQFGSNLIQAIDRNKAFGTSQSVTLQAPCDAAHVCFVDRRIIDDPSGSTTSNPDWHEKIDIGSSSASLAVRSVIKSSVETNINALRSGDQTNVFTVNSQRLVEPMEQFSTAAAAIRVTDSSQPSAICIATSNEQLRMRMTGSGREVTISRVSN